MAISHPLVLTSYDESGDSHRGAVRESAFTWQGWQNLSLCHLRGVSPLQLYVKGYSAWIFFPVPSSSMFSITYFIYFKHENMSELLVDSYLERHLCYLLFSWFFDNEYYGHFLTSKCIKTYCF